MALSNSPARRDEMPVDYVETLNRLAAEVRSANIRATLKENAELIKPPSANSVGDGVRLMSHFTSILIVCSSQTNAVQPR